MKVRNYNVSGTTHKKGAEGKSTAICSVTPSSSEEGMRASTIHIMRSRALTGVVGSLTITDTLGRLCDNVIAAHDTIPRDKSPKPSDQSVACRLSGSSGSTISGYA